jgi:Multidrug resistance efflux pump
MTRKKIVLIVVLLLAAVLAIHVVRNMRSAHAAAEAHPKAPVPVKVAQATQGDIALSLQLVGRVEAWSTVTLRAQVSGQLASLSFAPGTLVHKGDVLARIDPRLLQAELDQARGNVARDRAQLQKAAADQHRYAAMLAKGYVAKADYDTYQANLAVAEGGPAE